MLTEWLRTIADRHRPGIGIKPWVKYIDQSFDNRTQHTFRVTLRGFGWEMSGDIEAIKVMFADKVHKLTQSDTATEPK